MAVISNIHPLWDALPISVGKEEREYSERTALPVFEQIFQEAIDNVRQTDQEKNKAEYLGNWITLLFGRSQAQRHKCRWSCWYSFATKRSMRTVNCPA